MARFRWFDGNGGIYRYSEMQDLSVVATTARKITLEYNFNDGGYDPQRHVWRIEILTQGRSTWSPEGGPPVVTGGQVTGLRFFNAEGARILDISGLDRPLAPLLLLLKLDPFAAYEYLTAGDHSFVGADDSAAPGWTGDDIKTGMGADTVSGGGGDDFITDTGGADLYRGGAGSDTLSYEEHFWQQTNVISGITADLALGRITGPDSQIDRVAGIEILRGTFLADQIKGGRADERFSGLAGNDTINGGAGFDVASYLRDAQQGGTAGVRVDLAQGTAQDGFGNEDRLIRIEGAEGTDTGDLFIGSRGANWFAGGAGNDEFRAAAGDDTLNGGAGADLFVFDGRNFGQDVIEDFRGDQGDRIRINGAAFTDLAFSQDGTDTLVALGRGTIRLAGWLAEDVQEAFFLF